MFSAQDLSWFKQFKAEYVWAVEAVILLGVTILFVYLESLIYKRTKPQLIKKNRPWEYGLLVSLHKPLNVFIWLVGISLFFDIIGSYNAGKGVIFQVIPTLRKIIIVFCLLWFSLSFIKEIEKILMNPKENGRHLDKTTVRAIGQVLRVIVIITSIFVILQSTFGVGASAILAFAGGGGLTIGLAAKDMIANLFGGLMIFLDRPFVIGDRIRSHDKDLEGYVEHIGWRLTCVKNLDKVPVYIPNSIFLTDTIENPSRMTHRRIKTQLGIRYQDVDKVQEIAKAITQMLKQHHEIDRSEAIIVNLLQCGPSSLDYFISAFTITIDYEEFHRVQQEILLKILQIIKQYGAECAYPTTVVQLPQEIKFSGVKSF